MVMDFCGEQMVIQSSIILDFKSIKHKGMIQKQEDNTNVGLVISTRFMNMVCFFYMAQKVLNVVTD